MADKTLGSVLYATDGSRIDYDTAANLDATFRDVSAEVQQVRAVAEAGGGGMPDGGQPGQVLTTGADGSAAWADPTGMPGRGITSIVASTTDPTTATVTYTDGSTAALTLPQGAAGKSISSFGAPDGEGVSVVTFSDGSTTTITLPKGPQGERGERGLTGDTGATGPANRLSIGTVTGGATAGATITGEAPEQTLSLVLPQGARGDRGDVGPQGPPGVVSSASSYVIVGPGRPDAPTTTAGTITGAEPVGAEYRSTDGASVGAYGWRKRPGGAWAVIDGDTGPRRITLSSSVMTATTATLRRIGNVVTLGVADFTSTPGTTGYIASGMDGFKASPDMRNSPFTAFKDTTLEAVASFKIAQQMTPYLVTYKSTGSIAMTWTTADPWPAALPGTPA